MSSVEFRSAASMTIMKTYNDRERGIIALPAYPTAAVYTEYMVSRTYHVGCELLLLHGPNRNLSYPEKTTSLFYTIDRRSRAHNNRDPHLHLSRNNTILR